VHLRVEEQGPMMVCKKCFYVTTAKVHHFCPIDGTILNSAPELEVSNGTAIFSLERAEDSRR
jgi:hypothetical protein